MFISTISREFCPSSVAMCCSGLTISKSDDAMMSPAQTSPGPSTSSRSLPGLLLRDRRLMALMFSRMSTTSSFTPGMVEYSCSTPSSRTQLTAMPSMELRSTRRSGLPNVMP